MAHIIQVIIGKTERIKALAEKWADAVCIELEQDIAFIPFSDKLSEHIQGSAEDEEISPSEPFYKATLSLFELLQEESFSGSVGYLETEYFGGTGGQAAILFDKGIVFGPYKTENEWDKDLQEFTEFMPDKGAINKILKQLNVSKQNFFDEFDAIGLGHFRIMKWE